MKHADVQRPVLIVVRGMPGSGKSFLTTELTKMLGADDVVVLDPDTLDLADKGYQEFSRGLEQEGLDKAIHPFRWSRKLACDAISARKVVIWCQPFTVRGVFERLVAFLEVHARDQGMDLPLLVVEVEIDQETAKQRVTARKNAGGHGPTDATLAKRMNEYESYADSFRTVVVNGKDDVGVSAAAVVRALNDES